MMINDNFYDLLKNELERINKAGTAKRNERIIESFIHAPKTRALIGGKQYLIFNSNDYLGLRFEKKLKEADEKALAEFGTGPGAVRFISGTLRIYKQLEEKTAGFHKREECMIFSSAFAANLSVIPCLIKGQSRDSLISSDVLVVSDELNHRSIIDAIRVSGALSEQKRIYTHQNMSELEKILSENINKYSRVLIVTDGIFSMLGEPAMLPEICNLRDTFTKLYKHGVLVVVDDSHGVGVTGQRGRGVEEIAGVRADVLVGTYGKAFGSDGGYVVADKILIDYFRESAPAYIYSNPISPGTASSSLAAIGMVEGRNGEQLLNKLKMNIRFFKAKILDAGLEFVIDSFHPIQPILIGDSIAAKLISEQLFEAGILVTPINYPVVPKKKDEIRVQINAKHTHEEMNLLIDKLDYLNKKILS